MKILVTGASGFIGAAAVELWSGSGHEVIEVRRPGSASAGGARAVLEWDLSGPLPASADPGPVDAVVHLAQARRHRLFPADANEMFAVNVAATQALLDLAVRLGARRFCLASSGNVYEPYTAPLREDAPVRPVSYLGASKAAAEALALAYAPLLDVSVLRLFQPYGPGQTLRLVPELVRRVEAGEPVSVSQDGEGLRLAPTYVGDVASCMLQAIEQGWRGVFNLAAPHALSIRAMTEIIAAEMGRAATFVGDGPQAVRVIPVLDKLHQRVEPGRFTSFQAGIRATLQPAGEAAR